MKRFYKTIYIINMIFYFNALILSLSISKFLLENINPLWALSPYIFILVFLGYLKYFNKNDKKIYLVVIFAKFIVIITGYISGKYMLYSETQLILLFLMIFEIVILTYFEYKFFSTRENYFDKFMDTKPNLSIESLSRINDNNYIKKSLKKSASTSFKLQFHVFLLNVSYALIIISIILRSNTTTRVLSFFIEAGSIILMIYIFYKFLISVYTNMKISAIKIILIVIIGLLPNFLYVFQEIILQFKNGAYFAVLGVCSIPLWYYYKIIFERDWDNFNNKYRNITNEKDE